LPSPIVTATLFGLKGDNLKLLTQNSKMKKAKIKTFDFAIPAWSSEATGIKTCPGADWNKCGKICYARDGRYRMKSTQNAMEARLAITQKVDFVDIMSSEINEKLKRNPKGFNLRMHSSGDFYHRVYLLKWTALAIKYPMVTFYAYTKMVPFFRGHTLPPNMTVVFSYGGKFDNQITYGDRHAKVFPSVYALRKAGYTDASVNDTVAANPKIRRLGLVYHGRYYRSKVKPTLGLD